MMQPNSPNRKYEDEEMNAGNSTSSLVGGKEKKEPVDIPFCGFVSLQYYQPYFDVDTEDIKSRIMTSMIGFKDDSFLKLVDDKPDLYGPFWIATSLIFIIAVISHFSSYVWSIIRSKADWSYDFQSVVNVASFVYGFVGLVPIAIWLILRQFESKTRLVTFMCIYGYSLVAFIPATILCLVPSELVSWLAFMAACGISCLFLIRNIAPTIIDYLPRNYVTGLLGGLVATQVLFMLMLKFEFFWST